MKWLLLWAPLCVVGVWSLSGPSQVDVHHGEDLKVTCGYNSGYSGYKKYLCKGAWRQSCHIVISSDGTRKVIDGRFSIEDNLSNFSITMAGMKPQDSDIYQCGIEFTGNDAMHPIRVSVLPGVCRTTAPWVEMVDFPENFTFVKEKDLVNVSCQKQFVEKTFRLECRQVSHEFLLISQSEETPCVEKCKKLEQWDLDLTLNPDQEYYGPDELVELSCPAGYKANGSIIQCMRDKNQSSWNVTQVSCEPLGPSQTEFNLTSINSTGSSLWSFSFASLTFGLLPGIFLKFLIFIPMGGKLLCDMRRSSSTEEQGVWGKGESDGAVSNVYRQGWEEKSEADAPEESIYEFGDPV